MMDAAITHEKLLKLQEALTGIKRLVVLTHENPDPDSISSAVTLARIVSGMFHVPSVARYCGIVGRAENRELIRLLDLDIKLLSKGELQSKDAIALVDCQPYTGNVSIPAHTQPFAVIDHHPVRKTTKGTYIDIRDGYGATATILGEYLLASGLEVTSQLATALCYGISSETQRLGRETNQSDMKVYSALFALANKKTLSRIETPNLSRGYFKTLNHALHHSSIYKNAVVSNIGEIPEPDFVPIVADLLLRCERISWSLALGRFQGKLLISIRTTREKAQAGNFLRRLIGKRGTAGGHGMIAGGQIPCANLTEAECDTVEKEIVTAFLKKIGHRDIGEMTPLLIESKASS